MFSIHKSAIGLFTVSFILLLASCSDNNQSEILPTLTISENAPMLDIYKSASCGCCGKWIEHLKENGFQTKAHNLNNLSQLKTRVGIDPAYRSCHTAISKDGYVFEGHIPARLIQKFLHEKPEGSIGLTVPGMTIGSPGMEMGNKFMPYDVWLLKKDGSVTSYARVETLKDQDS